MIPEQLNELDEIPLSATRDLENNLRAHLDKCGLYYRLFGRVKSTSSTIKKFKDKGYCEDHKMQDLIGFRIALYFKDDIKICREVIKTIFVTDNESVDADKVDMFKPTRLNIVCKIPIEFDHIDPSIYMKYPICETRQTGAISAEV